MTALQRNVSASVDPVKLDRLAEVAVKVGLRLQPGQDLLLTAPSVALPLVRRIAEHAYKAGAVRNGHLIDILAFQEPQHVKNGLAGRHGMDLCGRCHGLGDRDLCPALLRHGFDLMQRDQSF